MMKTKVLNLLSQLLLITLAASCIAGAGSSKRGYVKDYSITTTTTKYGCGTTQYILFSTDKTTYSCQNSCATGTHIATTTELNQFNTSATDTELKYLNGSKGLCVSDSSAARPTGEVYIASNFCSCLNGKADIINDCDTYCAGIATTTAPILHASATLGADIVNNTKLGNLNNWCNTQLDGDNGTPQCTLSAWDGTNTIDNIQVTVSKTDNSFTADISQLQYNTTYVVKLVESKTGSNAASTEFQVRRIKQSTSTETTVGALKITPVSQYTCLQYGGTIDSTTGVITRTSYARVFYYFPTNETPAPIPAPGGTNQSQIVCHDEISNPGADNALYPRLELIPAHFTLWDKTEARFVQTNSVMAINSTIQTRLQDEYNTTYSSLNLFSLLQYPNRPNTSSGTATTTGTNTAQGYMMLPFINSSTNKAYCPTSTNFNGTDPLFKVLKDYISDTEGLYLGEKEAETIQDGNNGYKTVYGTMFVTESKLVKYGFYIQNGLKIKASADTLHNKTIYYYWPVNDTMDPLEQGDRKLFTVRFYDELNGNTPTGVSTTIRPSDKRIGCVPQT